MVGGTTSGYSLIGRRSIAIKPSRNTMIESTPAKIGRRMKKWVNFITMVCAGRGDEALSVREFEPRHASRDAMGLVLRDLGIAVGGHSFLRSDGHSGPDSGQAIDDDFLARLQTFAHDALAVDLRAKLHRTVGRSIG